MSDFNPHLSRRRLLKSATLGAALLPFAPRLRADEAVATAPNSNRYKIAVCDWMILKRQKLGAFGLARDLGADGVEVDMGGLGNRETFDSQLGNPATQKQFLDRARELKLEISSLAMSGFYAQSFATKPGIERIVGDCLQTMNALGVQVAFLPLGVQADLIKHPELRPVVLQRLKIVGKMAQQAGVVVGIETALDAAGEAQLLDEVASPGVKSYFNFANALQNRRDLHHELRTLGANRICQIHCSGQDGRWLQFDPKIDVPRVKQTLDGMGWSGWLVIERSRDASAPTNVKWNFGANASYLKSVFQSGPL